MQLKRVLAGHHKECLGLYHFIKETLEGRRRSHSRSAVHYVHRQPEWARQINRLQPKLAPGVSKALDRYLNEVAALARVIRLETAILKTNKKRLDSALLAVFRESSGFRNRRIRLPQ